MKTAPPTILIATRNQGKIREIQDLVRGLPVAFLSLSDLADVPDVVEDGETFEENALKKARLISSSTGLVTLADDSGLCVDALDGRPGVHSARYAGNHSSDEEKWRKILSEMEGLPNEKRSAQFVCVLALVDPPGLEELFRASCHGFITSEPRGKGGFGYDPIFYFEEARLTFGEMDRHSKNLVSHRGLALAQFSAYLKRLAAM
jgi:XTP/dITP diphosphohydrolase